MVHSTHQYVLWGCLGSNYFSHYLDGIEVASNSVQTEITEIMHKIYSKLINSLADGEANLSSQSKILFLSNLSAKFKANDLTWMVTCGLLPVLSKICYDFQNIYVPIAAMRLQHILALSCGIHAQYIESNIIEEVLEKMYIQLKHMYEIIDENAKNKSQERHLGDYLVIIRNSAINYAIKKILGSSKWMKLLFQIIADRKLNLKPKVKSLRPKLMALKLITSALTELKSGDIDREQKEYIITQLFDSLSAHMWIIPDILADTNAIEKQANRQKQTLFQLDDLTKYEAASDENAIVSDCGFDPDRCVSCTVSFIINLISDEYDSNF